MKENLRDPINDTNENKIYLDNKWNILEIKPKKYNIYIPNSESKLHCDKIILKNVMDFPIMFVILKLCSEC